MNANDCTKILDRLYASHTSATAAGDWERVESLIRQIDETIRRIVSK